MLDLLCYDEPTNQFFRTTGEHLKAVEKQIFANQPVSFEECLEYLGIEKDVQNEKGVKKLNTTWRVDHKLSYSF